MNLRLPGKTEFFWSSTLYFYFCTDQLNFGFEFNDPKSVENITEEANFRLQISFLLFWKTCVSNVRTDYGYYFLATKKRFKQLFTVPLRVHFSVQFLKHFIHIGSSSKYQKYRKWLHRYSIWVKYLCICEMGILRKKLTSRCLVLSYVPRSLSWAGRLPPGVLDYVYSSIYYTCASWVAKNKSFFALKLGFSAT